MRTEEMQERHSDALRTISLDGQQGAVTIPDPHLLFNGEFRRSGDNLRIVGDDGTSVFVADYFKNERLPILLAPDGAALSGDVVAALAGPRTPGQYAQAGAATGDALAIGRVATVQGNALVVRNGVAVTLNVGDAVFKGDVAQTQSGSALGIILADGTAFNLSASARMVLNEFVYDQAGSANSALINLVQGSFTFLAGQVAKSGGDMRVGTPVAVLGIRGTAVQVDINLTDGTTKMSVLVEPSGAVGSFNVYSLSGTLIGTVNNQGVAVVVTATGPLNAILSETQKTVAELQQALVVVQQVVQTQAVGQAILAAQPVNTQKSDTPPDKPPPDKPPAEKQTLDQPKTTITEQSTTKIVVTVSDTSSKGGSGEVKVAAVQVVSPTDSAPSVVPIQPIVTPIVSAPALTGTIVDQTRLEDTQWIFAIPAGLFTALATQTFAAKLANGNPLPSWLSFNPETQTFSGTPPQDFSGAIDLQVTATSSGLSTTLLFALIVAPVNDAPFGADKIIHTLEDVDYTFTVADFGFSDSSDNPQNSFFAVKITTLPTDGNITFEGNAIAAGQIIAVSDIGGHKLKFKPGNHPSSASFTFQVQDDGGNDNEGIDLDQTPNTITIESGSVNDVPSGTDKTVSTAKHTSYTFVASDFGFSDFDDSPGDALLEVRIVSLPTEGSLTLDGLAVVAGQDVSVSDIGNGLLEFTPAPNSSGIGYASFSFQVRDDGGVDNGGSDLDPTPNIITIDVITPENSAPTGTDTTVATAEETAYVFTVADFGFADPNDSPANSFLAIRIVALPTAGTLLLNGAAVNLLDFISVSDIGAGNFIFVPAPSASGVPYSNFTFQVQDDGGLAGGGVDLDPTPNTITINVSALNDAPLASNLNAPETYTEDTPLNLTDIVVSDVDSANVTVTLTLSDPAAGSLSTGTSGGVTSTYVAGTGVWTASGAVVNVNTLLAGLTFTPALNFNSNFTIATSVSDGAGGVVSGSKTVTGIAVNDAPTSSNDLVTTSEDVSTVLGLGDFGSYFDIEGSALAAVRITALESNGSLQYDTTGGGAWTDVTLNQQISASDIIAGRLRFVPDAAENGTPYATIGFQVSDGMDFSVSSYTLTVNVTGTNDAPVLDASKAPVGVAVVEDAVAPVGAVGTLVSSLIDFASPAGGLDNVTDADAGALTGIAITAADASNGTWFYSINGGTTWTALGSVSTSTALLLAADSDNRLYFRPNANYDGEANIIFRAWDQSSGSDGGSADTTSNGGGTAFSTATDTATFDVTPVNDAPIISGPNTVLLKEDTVPQWGSGQLTATDIDQGPTPLEWSIQNGAPSLQDYQFAIDQFKIIRNGSTFFDDTFNDGNAPPSAPNFVGGNATAYSSTGTFFEGAGRAALYGVNAVTLLGVNGNQSVGQIATLQTNIDPLNATAGLKSNMDFAVEGRFDLVIPKDVREQYGIRLTDSLLNQPGDNTVSLSVRRDADGVHVSLNEIDFVTGVSMLIQSITLAPLPGDNQITLRLSHSATSPGVIVASFDLFNNGVLTSTTNFTSTGHVFDNENWVSAQFFATGAPEDDTQLAGTYARLTISEDGEWIANVRNGQPAVQALAEGQTVQEVFYVTVTDDHGATTLQPITVNVTGTNDAPVLSGDLAITVSNGGTVVLSQEDILVVDPDIVDVLTFTVSDQVHGQVQVNGIASTTFTQQQLLSGEVTFVHDGDDSTLASFKVSVSDGLATTSAVTVLAAVPTMRLSVQSTTGFNFYEGEPIEQMGSGAIQSGATATQYTIVNAAADRKFVVEGVGFTFTGGSPPTEVTGGIIAAIRVFQNSSNAALFTFVGDINAAAWHDAIVTLAAGDNGLIEALVHDWTFAFVGNAGPDIATNGGDGNDFFRATGGNDLFDGQLGFDRANYSNSSGAINVQLADGVVTKFTDGFATTVAGIDTLSSIELITGTQFNDTFNAGATPNNPAGFNKDSTNSGSVEGGNAIANVAGTSNEFEGRGGNDLIVGNGNTRIAYTHATAGVIITFTSWMGNLLGASGQATGNASVGQDMFSGINSVRGSYFADQFFGSNNLTGVEVFEGRGGDDFIDGGVGFDRAAYQFDDNGDNTGIVVNLAAGTVIGGFNTGTDTLRSIESVGGTEFDDIYNAIGFTGSSAFVPSINSGNSGASGASSDFNEFEGRGGDDTVSGNGNTRVTYSNALAGVAIDLSSGVAFGTAPSNLLLGPSVDIANVGNDSFNGVTHARGSEFSDVITGNSSNNQLEGQGGNDALSGGGGNDRLTGGTGSDRFVYSTGYAVDNIVDFNKGQGDRIDLRGVAGLSNFAGLNVFQSTTNAANTVIFFSSGQNLILENFTFSNLAPSDFLFVGQVSVTVHTRDGYNFGTLYDDIAGVNSALTNHDSTHYVVTNPSAGLIFSLVNGDGTGFDVDSNHVPVGTGGKVNVIGIYDSSYNILAVINGVNFDLAAFVGATQTYATSYNSAGLDAIFATISYNAVGSFDNSFDEDSVNFGGDTFISGTGNDVFNGLTNPFGDFNTGDTVDYSHVPAGAGGIGVTVSLMQSSAQDTVTAGTDTLINIENLRGSVGNDTLTGTGNSILEGGVGSDALIGQVGGGGDTASYEHAAAGLIADLTTPANNTGEAAGDTYTSIENLRGSVGNDTLTGDNNDNILEGGLGADSLNGGDGNDTASYVHASSGVSANLATALNSGEALGDSYSSIENLFGSRFNDHLTGNSMNNVLDGGFGGNDILTGGAAADTFKVHGGATVITDFNKGEGDKIDLYNFTALEVDTLIAATTGDTIDFGGGMTLTLQNTPQINNSGLNSTDFILHS